MKRNTSLAGTGPNERADDQLLADIRAANSTTLEVTATPEYAVRSMLKIARQPATAADDEKWCQTMLNYMQQAEDAGLSKAAGLEKSHAALMKAVDAGSEAIKAVMGGVNLSRHQAGHLKIAHDLLRAELAKARLVSP